MSERHPTAFKWPTVAGAAGAPPWLMLGGPGSGRVPTTPHNGAGKGTAGRTLVPHAALEVGIAEPPLATSVGAAACRPPALVKVGVARCALNQSSSMSDWRGAWSASGRCPFAPGPPWCVVAARCVSTAGVLSRAGPPAARCADAPSASSRAGLYGSEGGDASHSRCSGPLWPFLPQIQQTCLRWQLA